MTLRHAASPMLVTDRLELWLPQAGDLPRMIEIVANPETHRFLGPQGTYADHMSRIMRNSGSWGLFGYGILAVKRRDNGRIIGNCGIFHTWRGLGEDFDDRAEGGWIIDAEHVGNGYAEEAMRAVLAWFDAEFGREVVALITLGNGPSFRLAEKLGFRDLREAEMPGGEAVQLLRRPPPGS
ncbi:GNAT family N-acetyltransferase [Aurantiacibacter sediminis]|uniref:GNAT family N-acetyltransferase n=1 Tax=Aurantiacibacter sediminis TaxID=2793064 RepID=A0ABS0N045_9SPHN|nr:GNAT family N-acetyltransferase [Aurantiacibacter sediminis]MBH5321347.1 GNAT family N-acetyltransferase [Aurantiacibacter sediminis]